MENENQSQLNNEKTGANVVAKAGIWFTICNLALRGMAFFTVPIFTRLLSPTELGGFSNYSSWITILLVITSFELYTSIIRSKVEFEGDIDAYIWSILSFSTVFTLAVYVCAIVNSDLVTRLIQMDMKYVHLMFAYFLTSPAYSMLITKHRAFYRYKVFVLITAIVTLSSTALSLLFVMMFEDKLWGRSLGQYLPSVVCGALIFIYLAFKGKMIKLEYWKYALVICVPLVPHTLSANLLSTSDRIVLTKLCGTEMTAIYSIAGTCYHIVTILMQSMNQAWTPWLFENLKTEDYGAIKKFSRNYITIFMLITFGVILIGPELILIFGGKRYLNAVYCLLPLMTSCIIQFIYLFYVNTEFYTKKTVSVAIVTTIAAALNIVLNYLLIPLFPDRGYEVVSYTTLIGYIVLLVLHYLIVKHRKLAHIFDNRYFVLLIIGALVFMGAAYFLYNYIAMRYGIIVVYGIFLLIIFQKNRNSIITFMKK